MLWWFGGAVLLVVIGNVTWYFHVHGPDILDILDRAKLALGALGLALLLMIVALSVEALLGKVFPDWDFLHGTNEDGESFDRRGTFAVLISFPVTYLLIRGFNAWRKDRVEGK